MRCGICGRPLAADLASGVEKLLPREIACQGCCDDFKAALAAVGPEGKPLNTPDQAFAIARQAHINREAALLPQAASGPSPALALKAQLGL